MLLAHLMFQLINANLFDFKEIPCEILGLSPTAFPKLLLLLVQQQSKFTLKVASSTRNELKIQY